MKKIGRKYKNIRRYKQIGEVFMKYGFPIVAEKLRDRGYIPKIIFRTNKVNDSLTSGQRLRMAFEELGPTFVKMGQILSTRRDIFPEEIINELVKLQDEVVPFPFEQAEVVFEKEMKRKIGDCFSDFDPIPIASASIGQVYQATLKTGEKVVVKIQRPHIRHYIETDIDILLNIAKILDDHLDKNKPYNIVEIVEEFSHAILRELDYSIEARNTYKFYMNFKEDSHIYIPEIYWDFTCSKVLTMERIYGVKIVDIDSLKLKGWNLKRLAYIGAKSFMRQVFIHGFFHGDPHPGNIFAVDQNTIAFIDFGVVGYLDRETMSLITTIFTASARRDVEKIISTLAEIDAINSETNVRRLKEDIAFLINLYYNMPLKNLNLGEALKDAMELSFNHHVRLPSQFTMLLKSIVTLEGTGKILDPDFSLSSITKDFMKEMYLNKLNPFHVFAEAREYSEEVFHGLRNLPRQMSTLMKKLENNQIQLQLEQVGLDKLKDELTILTNKLSISLITSALIVGSSLMIDRKVGPMIKGIPLIGAMGYLLASILGFTIIASILVDVWKKK